MAHKVYRIHPGIGIARLGNSRVPGEEGYFIGPEAPNLDFTPPPDGKYRDGNDKIRRQAARFRIYEFTYSNKNDEEPNEVREITSDEAKITWRVNLANRKSFTFDSTKVINDPGEKTVSGAGQSVDVFGTIFGANVQLGKLLTDADSRLLVLGGFGESASPSGAPLDGLHNYDWYDDASDGPVRAEILFKDGSGEPPVQPAWVVVGVPAYAEQIINIVTSYDLAYHMATELSTEVKIEPPNEVSFTRDIYPVLKRTVLMQWTSTKAKTHHSGESKGNFLAADTFDLLKSNNKELGSAERTARKAVFREMKNPSGGGRNMPDLRNLSLTETQYKMFEKWRDGEFKADWEGEPVLLPFDQLSDKKRPSALDKAALDSMVGGSFSPGIETGKIMGNVDTYERPFRINVSLEPGSLTESLSVPWQADFVLCGTGWWPGARPNIASSDGENFYSWVPRGTNIEGMLDLWKDLGFIKKKKVGGAVIYVEDERKAPE